MKKGFKPVQAVTTVGAAGLCVAAVVGVVMVLSDSDPTSIIARASSAALMLILFSPLGLAGVVLSVRRPSLAWFGYATTVVAFVAFVILTKQFWDESNILAGDDWKLPGIALTVSLACGQISLLLAWARSGALVSWLGWGAALVIAVLAVLTVLEITSDIDVSDRLYGVLTILYLLPILLLPLFTLGRAPREPASPQA